MMLVSLQRKGRLTSSLGSWIYEFDQIYQLHTLRMYSLLYQLCSMSFKKSWIFPYSIPSSTQLVHRNSQNLGESDGFTFSFSLWVSDHMCSSVSSWLRHISSQIPLVSTDISGSNWKKLFFLIFPRVKQQLEIIFQKVILAVHSPFSGLFRMNKLSSEDLCNLSYLNQRG